MGVRHKTYVMEGVQFHPESIASESGDTIFSNFLQWDGGLWETMTKHPEWVTSFKKQSSQFNVSAMANGIPLSSIRKLNSTSQTSILEKIRVQRLQDMDLEMKVPGRSRARLDASLRLGIAPQVNNFKARLQSSITTNGIAVIAEIKRASPSKGDIDLNAHAASQAMLYARGGAAAISVLTEPKWFKGSMQDLSDVRKAIDHLPNRPCLLCKDFLLSEYHILLARLAGADTVLLIVAILPQKQLEKLLHYSRSLGMEPLVEVATPEEMKTALAVGSKIIGINNRDLNTFTVDMERTTRLASNIPDSIILLALSGITGRADVANYTSKGVHGVLVGQSLMESPHPASLIQTMLGPVVKICGITNAEDAKLCKKGASHLGLIFAESPRKVTPEQG
jgi:anthranilate synthase / indole-3-glycerol phosphate synthase / phosphoribosylanthranilate isomerase